MVARRWKRSRSRARRCRRASSCHCPASSIILRALPTLSCRPTQLSPNKAQRANMPTITGPIPPISRATSSVSVSSRGAGGGGTPSSAAGSERKKRARHLLRDYYGLAGTGTDAAGAAEKKGDPLDIGASSLCVRGASGGDGARACARADSPGSFSPAAYLTSLSSTASLPELLKRENDLINGACS